MNNRQKLIDKLMNREGFDLVDIKFSTGFGNFITEDEFCGEVLKGMRLVEEGKVLSVDPSFVDGECNNRTVAEFLS